MRVLAAFPHRYFPPLLELCSLTFGCLLVFFVYYGFCARVYHSAIWTEQRGFSQEPRKFYITPFDKNESAPTHLEFPVVLLPII